ncbi:MAG: hypothetical protein NTW96_24660 [Planctomycetia bacterium]|nr:hypothetical protein [Planctomycetia bacterium]
MKRERYDLKGKMTPWGPTQDATEYAPGIVFHSTAGHGGFHLGLTAMRRFRNALPRFKTFAGGPWFEEDCDACSVVVVFPEAFDEERVRNCEEIVRSMAKHGYANSAAVAHWLNSKERNHAPTTV